MEPAWLTARAADVPAGDAWLGPAEREVLATLRVEKRRSDWRLGRWAAKQALAAARGVPAQRAQILAAHDGAPEAWDGGTRIPVSLSLSHRGGRALAVVAPAPAVVGCDLELIEPRSAAFVRDWLSPPERALLAVHDGHDHERLANVLWSAREAAAKVRREGLRLDVRRARVELDPGPRAGWQPLRVVWDEAEPTAGWWRAGPEWVMTVAGVPAPEPPVWVGRNARPGPGLAV